MPLNNQKIGKYKLKTWVIVFWSFIAIGLIPLYFFIDYVFSELPSLEELDNPRPNLASNVFSEDGERIGQFFIENRVRSDIDSIPQSVIQALISTEDKSFYSHWGVDIERIVKAIFKDVFLFKREGGSTLTQQLSKNLYELRTINESFFDVAVRKVREAITSVQIEKTYTKEEILEMYLNISYFGRGAYGIEMASSVYFDKKVQELTIPEAAMLVAILKSSVYYDPVRKYDNALRRRNIVLYHMYEEDFISEDDYNRYKSMPIKVNMKRIEEGFESKDAPYFVEYIRRQLTKLSEKYKFNIYKDGLTIYTSLNAKMQRFANDAVSKHIGEYQKIFDRTWKWSSHSDLLYEYIDKEIQAHPEFKTTSNSEEKKRVYNKLKNDPKFIESIKARITRLEAGFVCIDAKTGEIKAMVGGSDPKNGLGLNHAAQIKRQPGSSFKPIIYTAAIDNGLYPAFPIINQPFNYNGWSPANFDHKTGGYLTLREALKRSENIIAARLIIEGHVSLEMVDTYAKKLGIKSKLDLFPAIALGTSEISPLELTAAYATIANKGIYSEPISILQIDDKDGNTIVRFNYEQREGISEETAFIMADMMKSVIQEGTGRRVLSYISRPAAGKTGTTQGYGDAWFVGYTPQLAAGSWVGFDDRRISFPGEYGQGSRAALPIWGIFMKSVYDSLKMPIEDFKMPESGDVVFADFCLESIKGSGVPRLYSSGCGGSVLKDLIKLKDMPNDYNIRRDTTFNIAEPDNGSREATVENDE